MKTSFTSFFKRISQKQYKVFIGNGLYRTSIYKPESREYINNYYKNTRLKDEKYNHRLISRPVVENQTLLKEREKAKTFH